MIATYQRGDKLMRSLPPLSNVGFLSKVATLLGGKGVEAAIALAFIPIVSRIFTPEDYGLAVSLIAIATILMPCATLMFERAIVLSNNKTEECSLIAICIISSLVFSASLALLNEFGVFDRLVEGNGGLAEWLWVIPIYLLIRSLLVIGEQIAIKAMRYKQLATAGVFDVAIAMAIRISAGYKYGSEVCVLIVAYAVGMIVRSVSSLRGGIQWRGLLSSLVNIKELLQVSRQYKEFPLYQMGGTLFRASTNNLPVILLTSVYSPAIGGVYAMAAALSFRPLSMVLMSYRSVFLQQGAALQNDKSGLRSFFIRHTLLTIVIGLIPFLALFFLSPLLFPWLLGENWVEVGNYIQILSPWLYSLFIGMPAVGLFVLIRKQHIWLKITVVNSVLQLSPFVLATVLALDIMQLLWLYSIIGAVVNGLMVFIAFASIDTSGDLARE